MIEQYRSVADIPEEWDSVVGDNIYLTRKFMAMMESADDSEKHYYAVLREGKIDTVFTTVRCDDFNLGMFSNFDKKIKITLVYVPLSVTRAGIAYGSGLNEAAEFIKKIRGYKMFLNLPDVSLSGYAKGYTCPKCALKLRWNTFDEYMNDLRSSYRYRYNKALRKSAPLKFRYLESGEEFTSEMYKLYENVHNKSRIRVEKLTERFFRGECFKIFVAEDGEGIPRGFVQLLHNGDELVFEFVGLDYTVNSEYDTYIAMLLEIVRYGIDNGFKTIDFGQTADDAKLKIGCEYEYLYAMLHHSNKLVNFFLRKFANKIECKPVTTKFDVFKL